MTTRRTAVSTLTDEQLVASLQDLLGRSRELTVQIVVHLAEVEARELHLAAACSSMFDYCTRVLGFDEAAAYNRIYVAHLARRFPLVLDLLAKGRLHLTGARLLGPHLTEDGHIKLLKAAAGMSKRQIEQLIAERKPKPDVPDRIRKRPAPRAIRPGAPSTEPGGGDAARMPRRARSGAGSTGPSEPEAAGSSVEAGTRRGSDPGRTTPLAADRYKVEFTGS